MGPKTQDNRVRRAAHRAGVHVARPRNVVSGEWFVCTPDGAVLFMDASLDRVENYIREHAAEDVRRLSDGEVLKRALALGEGMGLVACKPGVPGAEPQPLAEVVPMLMQLARADMHEEIVTRRG